MKRYEQEIIFSINKEFDIKNTIVGRYTTGVIVDDECFKPYIHENKLILKEALGYVVWNSKYNSKAYFMGVSNIDKLVNSGGIEIIMEGKIKVEEL